MVIVGIILLIVGVSLFFVQQHQKQKVFSIKSARSVTAAELTETAGLVAEEIGGGSWRDYVKLWGEVVADAPLRSEHKQEACVYYTSKIERDYETFEITRDADGNTKSSRVRKTETVSNNRQSIPFWLRDRSGMVRIEPDGADIETIEIMNEFRHEKRGDTLGYRYRESILPVGRNVLVVGAVSDLTGEVTVLKPTQPQHKYIISFKDEESLAASVSRNAQATFYGMVSCLGVGGLLIVIDLLT